MTAEEARRLDDATVWLMQQGAWRNERDWLADCVGCGRPFWARQNHTRYCDAACKNRWHYHRNPVYRARVLERHRSADPWVPTTRNCAECGGAFTALVRSHVYCTARCRNRITTRRYYWRHHQRTE